MLENYLLEQLIAFAETGTLSKAAAKLHVTQPALSKAMHRIEREFGIALFQRSHSHIELNENGQVAVQYAKRALQANNEIVPKTLAFYQRRHTLKIAGCSTIALRRLTKMCQDLYPKMTLTTSLVTELDANQLLTNGDFDLIIATDDVQNSEIIGKKFLNENLMLSLPKTLPLAQQKEVSFSELTGMDILAHAGSGIWLDICHKQNRKINLLVQENMQTLQQLVNASDLPAFSSTLTKGDKRLKKRCTIAISDEAAKVKYYLLCRKSDYQNFEDLYHNF